MRPRHASRRVSRESGEVFVSSLHLHNLPPVQVSVGTEPLELSSLFFSFLPLPALLSTCFPPVVRSKKGLVLFSCDPVDSSSSLSLQRSSLVIEIASNHVPLSTQHPLTRSPTRHRPRKDAVAFPASFATAPLTTCEPQTSSPTCCWWMKTLHASAPEVSYRQEGDCNGIPTICMVRLYRWARTQVRFLSLDGFHLYLVGSPLF
jgi:hypothetical protein